MNHRTYYFVKEAWIFCCLLLPALVLLYIGQYEPIFYEYGGNIVWVSIFIFGIRQGLKLWSYRMPIWLKIIIFVTSLIIIPILEIFSIALFGGYHIALIIFICAALGGLYIQKSQRRQWFEKLSITELDSDQMKYKWKMPKPQKQFSFANELLTLTRISVVAIWGPILLNLPMMALMILEGDYDFTPLGFIIIFTSIIATIIFIPCYYNHLSNTQLNWFQTAIFGLLPLIGFPVLMVISIVTGFIGILFIGIMGVYKTDRVSEIEQ